MVRVDGDLSDALILERGTPQGSVISPVLFSLIINDLPGTWRTGSNLVDLAKRAQAGLDAVWDWSLKWGFKICQTNTVGMLFGNNPRQKLDLNLGVNKSYSKRSFVS